MSTKALWSKIFLLNTIGDTISMQVEPWFSLEVGKDFLKRENGGGNYYHGMVKRAKSIHGKSRV